MRVPDAALYSRSLRDLDASRASWAKAQSRAITGRRVDAASDDPLAFSLAQRETSRAGRAQSHLRAVDVAVSKLSSSDSALDHVGRLLSRAKEIAVGMSTDTVGATDRAAAAVEAREIREQILSLANTQVEGRYLFAGYRDGAAPFDSAGAYLGDTSSQRVEVAPGVRLPTGLTGDRVFGAAGGADVLGTLAALETALNAGGAAGVRATLGDLGSAIGRIADARAELGSYLGSADTARAVARRAHDRSLERRADLVEADPVKAYAELARAQQSLRAAVQIATMLPPPGLAGSGG